jgi:hypothetical protein
LPIRILILGGGYFYWAEFVKSIETEAAPMPEMGFGDEFSSDWVAVDVAEFFDALTFGVNVKVVITGLPNVFFGSRAGETLLEDLHAD